LDQNDATMKTNTNKAILTVAVAGVLGSQSGRVHVEPYGSSDTGARPAASAIKDLLMRKIASIAMVALISLSCSATAAEHEVKQKGNAFSMSSLKIKVGDAVNFRNDDPHFHDVFSLSDVQTFDLGSYAQGQAKSVTFKKEGKVDVECAIHPGMKMTVDVAK
jgi:plastocyanin